jgi:hypothetical protein
MNSNFVTDDIDWEQKFPFTNTPYSEFAVKLGEWSRQGNQEEDLLDEEGEDIDSPPINEDILISRKQACKEFDISSRTINTLS